MYESSTTSLILSDTGSVVPGPALSREPSPFEWVDELSGFLEFGICNILHYFLMRIMYLQASCAARCARLMDWYVSFEQLGN